MTFPHPSDSPEAPGGARVPDADAGRAFEALVTEHYGRLCSFVFRFVGSREAAEDVVHDVLLKVWRRRHDFEFREPTAYLYQAVRNEAVSHSRRQAVQHHGLARLEGQGPQHAPAASGEAEANDLAAAVTAAVNALPQRCRLIFTMHREQGLSYNEIAQALNLSVKTVQTQMTRAFRALRIRLAPFLSITLALVTTARESHRFL